MMAGPSSNRGRASAIPSTAEQRLHSGLDWPHSKRERPLGLAATHSDKLVDAVLFLGWFQRKRERERQRERGLGPVYIQHSEKSIKEHSLRPSEMASPSDRPLIAPTTGAPYPPAPPVVAHHPPSQPHHHLLPPQQYQRLSPTHAARADQVTHPHQVFAHYTTMHQQQQQQGQQGHPQYQQQSQQQYSPSYPPQQGGVHVQPMQGSSYPPQLTQQPQHPHHLPPPAQYSSGGYSYPSHHPQQQQPGPTTQQHYPHRQQPQHHHQHHQQAYPDYPRPAFPYDYLSDGSGQRVGSGGERQPPYDPIERRAGGHDTVGEPRPPAHLLREFQPGRQITITRETIRPTYEAFIKAFHNEPTDKCSVEEHVVKFMQPPRNQKRSFMPFDLFELVKFYGGVDKVQCASFGAQR
ncbi:uncharacterized protein EV422DRAFT_69718 [Fimicolochytrium jonesii]|uniref:uncharacterized protein n=1 Tax=Fimicolochytrium jonesii TaxID=1396493 RepID=UPI0022FEFDFA|nr:uncharacterized protein EV422DRAFT_69718 [Fimicolochytrium jonesii]KAI8820423.1 hypothetical protein EV422DRAFT_69718 [Fimicolochytrium jonesii]